MADLRNLHPAFAPYAQFILSVLRQYGNYVITSAYRSPTEQAALYGRWLKATASERASLGIMTPAPPGRSQHERGFAVDIARIGLRPMEDPVLHELGMAWRGVGGVWGGERDPVHFEAPKSWTGRQ